MRLAAALLATALLAAPGLAEAGIHLHLPKAHPHSGRARRAAEAQAAGAPVSDTPDSVWAGRNGR